ncbi:signal peptide peptidase SppA [Pseudaquidulcibacter saccharophilus]|uniref:signal peptide peptidase SppA n=1 Tax=Pseudaquidulcibacter saccharophilus TaxID=2831900 RepID=UPI001EFF22AF|nr:signal peptide peptidase SppA [Pseudaquidulcibacter saccharophilus]
MKQFLFTIAGVFVGLILFFVILPIILLAGAAGSSKPVTPSNSVLVLDLRKQITDQKPASPFASMDGSIAVVDVVNKLYLAQSDNNVKGLYIRAPEAGIAPAHAEEIRQAIIDFQNSGKFVVAHAQGFEMPTLSNYATVSSAKEIWMQEGSDFTATGLVSETMFYGGLFEKFGIVPQFEQFYEYKNAANVYTQKDYTEAHREATTSLLSSIYNSFLADIAFDRKVEIEKLKTTLDAAPLTPEQALQAKLITHIGMPEEALDFAISQAGGKGKAQALDFADYSPSPKSGPSIAVINGEGAIITGPDQQSLFSKEQIMNSDAITAAIRDATDDNDIKAIVFRVSSPGGSAIGSEQIWAAVERAKAKKKPVVISMGAYAASGGYYVSAGADKIVAMPTTITGSIGVLGGKMAVNGALNKYTGINVSSIQIGGPYATALSGAEPFTNSQREAFHNAMARIYTQFTGKVAAGRKLPIEKVQEIAKGRVWTGQQAQGIGLVDKVGGLMTAIDEAKTLAGIDKNKTVTLKQYPVPEDPFKALASMFGSNTQAARAAAVYGLFLGDARLNEVLTDINAANDNKVQAKEYMRVK